MSAFYSFNIVLLKLYEVCGRNGCGRNCMWMNWLWTIWFVDDMTIIRCTICIFWVLCIDLIKIFLCVFSSILWLFCHFIQLGLAKPKGKSQSSVAAPTSTGHEWGMNHRWTIGIIAGLAWFQSDVTQLNSVMCPNRPRQSQWSHKA